MGGIEFIEVMEGLGGDLGSLRSLRVIENHLGSVPVLTIQVDKNG